MVQPRASSSNTQLQFYDAAGPRKLISNEAVTKENYLSLSTMAKEPSAPSASAQPSSATNLIPNLRWANIGWYYHWGIKQYDFARGKEAVMDDLRNVCKEAVGSVDWEQVFDAGSDDLDFL